MRKHVLRLGILLMLGVFVIGISLPAMAGVAGSGNQQAIQGNMKGAGQGMQNQTMLKAVTDLTGLDTVKIRENRRTGSSLLSIAKENGVDETALINKITSENQAKLKARLDAGSIDQAQYDTCLTQMNERIKERVNRTGTGNANGGKGNRQGGMGRCQQIQ
ncbi:MAG: hypothetical protein PHC92_01955 [Syntrophomonadaceae bacterium]|nr:hypothetical protein [Syntrophomonadaceae bacterium]MDD3022616.1 hypothetical protein [Syntrophomonadaceae bacterium]